MPPSHMFLKKNRTLLDADIQVSLRSEACFLRSIF